MIYELNQNVKFTAKVVVTGEEGPSTVQLTEEPGVVKKRDVKGDESRHSYHVQTQYGVHLAPASCLAPVEVEE